MKTIRFRFEDVNELRQIIKNSGVIAFPTETVYGLGIRSDSFLAYKNIFEAKDRPEDKNLTLMLYDKEDISKYAVVDEKASRLIDTFMPGAITLILKKKENTDLYGDQNTIGIRIPDSKDTLNLLKEIGLPMYVTSANISGKPSSTSDEEVLKQLDGRIEAIVLGEARNKEASTVVSVIDGNLVILREGPISLAEIKGVYER